MDRPDQSTGHGKTGTVGGCTPEAFASLLADLRAELTAARPVDRDRMLNRMQRPKSFEGKPWVWQAITLAEAADLTGLAVTTLRRYSKPYLREPGARRTGPSLPPPLGRLPAEGFPRMPPNVYDAGAIALWRAANSRSKPQEWRRRAPARVTKDQRLWSQTSARRQFALRAFLRAVIREDTSTGVEKALEMVAAAGLDTAGMNLRYAYVEARRAEAQTFIDRLAGVSVHPDGLVTMPQIAAVYGVRHGSLHRAVTQGSLVAAGEGAHGRKLFDPARLRIQADLPGGGKNGHRLRSGLSRLPVDMDHPLAAPLP
jgi:hypothetical protein